MDGQLVDPWVDHLVDHLVEFEQMLVEKKMKRLVFSVEEER